MLTAPRIHACVIRTGDTSKPTQLRHHPTLLKASQGVTFSLSLFLDGFDPLGRHQASGDTSNLIVTGKMQ